MRLLENTLWITGILLIGLFFAAQAWAEFAGRRDVASVLDANAAHTRFEASASSSELSTPIDEADPDAEAYDAVLAVLRIPSLALQVAVNHGTSESVLLRGAGLVEGSPEPGSVGNVAIAAHRDSHFRSLKDVAVGDLIELETVRGSHSYRVTELSVVEPDAVHVLDDVGSPVLTLVTCYPFYFVGNAPQRYIVRAVAAEVLMQDQLENPREAPQ